jgi:hypothetical protein
MIRKRILSGLMLSLSLSFVLLSCQERVDGIILTEPVVPADTSFVAIDTAYMAAVEAPQARRVLVEEFTGVSCPPCPRGHVALEAILAQHHNAMEGIDSISVIGIQSNGIPQAEPVHDAPYFTRHDNRTADGSEIYNSIYRAFGSIPRAGIDRVPTGGSLAVSSDLWSTKVTDRLKVPTRVNLHLSRKYIDSNRKLIITLRAAYTKEVTQRQTLNIAIVEDDIIDAQKNGLVIDSAYKHEHVLRDMITLATGNVFLTNIPTKAAGQVYEKNFIYKLDSGWVPEHCRIIAYIANSEATDREVQQVAEVSIK